MLENIFFYVGRTHCIDCSDRNTIGAHIIQIDDDELHCTALYRGMCIANVIDAKLEHKNCKARKKTIAKCAIEERIKNCKCLSSYK